MLLEAISQNCSVVATAKPARGGCRRAAVGNSIEAPRHSEATTTFIRRAIGPFVLTLCVVFASLALAVEGGLGRPISGMQITPFAGVIPPEPGLAVATGETYYEGSIGWRSNRANSRSSCYERGYESGIYTNRVVLHLAHADQGVELCFVG